MAAEAAVAAQPVAPGVGTVSTLGESCERGGVGHGESWIARGNGFDDIASGLTLVYPVTHLFGGGNGFRSALVGDAGLVERCQEACVGVGIGVCRRRQGSCGGDQRKHDKRSHGLILIQIDAFVPTQSRLNVEARCDAVVIVTSWTPRISSAAVNYFSWSAASA